MGGASALTQGLGTYMNYNQQQQQNQLFNQLIGNRNMGGGGGTGFTNTPNDFSGMSEYGGR
jgi:hypothetical protein